MVEFFPDAKQREVVLGYTQAFSSLGGAMVTSTYISVIYAEALPAVAGGHEAWRYTLMSGLIPAIPFLIIRPFLPESPVRREKKAQGTLNGGVVFTTIQKFEERGGPISERSQALPIRECVRSAL